MKRARRELVCVWPGTPFVSEVVKNANPLSWPRTDGRLHLLLLSVAFGWILVLGATGAEAPKPASEYFAITVGDRTLQLQIAVSPNEMMRGLMGRKSLKSDEGMLFVYAKPQVMSFWMRNTPLPLDIGFFDVSGQLREHYPLYPFDETLVKSRSESLQFALEVNQGWFRENRVTRGAMLDLKAVQAALKLRGFDPVKFGMMP